MADIEDTLSNNTLHNDMLHNDTLHNDMQKNDDREDHDDRDDRDFSENANANKCKNILKDLIKLYSDYDINIKNNTSNTRSDNDQFHYYMNKLCRKYKYMPSKRELGIMYRDLLKNKAKGFTYNQYLINALITKGVRSDSGILNVSVSMPPDKFSCKYNCHFCPNEPNMPRSYLSNEDVFLRASVVGFDTVKQVYNRLSVLEKNGHPIDKLEFRVLGGTFSCYDHSIADEFIRDLYYAANTYYDYVDSLTTDVNTDAVATGGGVENKRLRGTIEEEQAINVTARVHVVGLGVETRPDEINEKEIIRFRRYGVTRVELGVQHTDDSLLRKMNRGHLVAHSKRAIRLLKDYGFKVEIHIMADLPGATPEGDMECYKQVLLGHENVGGGDLIPDYMKDYPCLDVSFTKVKEWKAQGKWQPYSEKDSNASELKRVLIYRQSITPPWVRVNRIQRDFKAASENQYGYSSNSIKSNLAQLVKNEAEAQNIYCKCIRCCEVRGASYDINNIEYKVHSFIASGAQEYFISCQIEGDHRPILLGFLRLRLSEALKESIIGELKGCTAMIRELHVYGRIKHVGDDVCGGVQHLGIGKKLLNLAEDIATANGYNRIAVISGIGVRDYYRKRGYKLNGTYMIKDLFVADDIISGNKEEIQYIINNLNNNCDIIYIVCNVLIMIYLSAYLYVL